MIMQYLLFTAERLDFVNSGETISGILMDLETPMDLDRKDEADVLDQTKHC